MSQDALRVEFRVDVGKRAAAPKPDPGAMAERQRLDRAARRARNLALAYWIDGLVRSGHVADLAAVARMCRVSRARVSSLLSSTVLPPAAQNHILASGMPPASIGSWMLTSPSENRPSDADRDLSLLCAGRGHIVVLRS